MLPLPSPRKSHASEVVPTVAAEASKLDTSVDLHGLIEDLSVAPPRSDDHLIPTQVTPVSKLSELQQRVLQFERKWWRHAGSKEQAIREQFELSATRYYQMLNKLLDLPEALEFDPVVVGRLRRLRASRSRARSSR